MRKNIAVFFGFLLLAIALNGYAATQQPASKAAIPTYTEGVKAFQHGDYTVALKAFLRARTEGYRGSELAYSLGVTYYRLGRYTDAKREFKSLLSDRKLAALSHYNLGRIAEAQKDRASALREYRVTFAKARQPKLKALADSQIRRLTSKPPRSLSWFGYANVTTGYDDNVALAPQKGALLPNANTGSPLLTFLAGGGHQLTGTYSNGIVLFANVYNTDYFHLSRYDESMFSFGGKSRHTSGLWAWQIGLTGSHITVGGSGFETLTSLRFNAQRALGGGNTLAGGYYYDRISGQSTYKYLDGSQQRLFIEDRIRNPLYNLTFGFQHEINSRKDLTIPATATTTAQFLSASPTRNRLYADFHLFPKRKLSWRAGFKYEKSRYSPADILASGTITRDDTLYVWRMGAEYELMPHWSLKAQYRYLNKKSDISNYAYKSNLYTISMNYLYF